jgi:predicted ATP-dependent protease
MSTASDCKEGSPSTGGGLEADRLYRACDSASLGFITTAELEPLQGRLDQDDALSALAFGIDVASAGYNVFVLGAPGSGRTTFVRDTLRARSASSPTPPDLCYVFNFRDPKRPRALSLPAGRGRELQHDTQELVQTLRTALPRALATEQVSARRAEVASDVGKQALEQMEGFQAEMAADEYVALVKSGDTISVLPARGHEPIGPDALQQLPQALREEIESRVRAAQLKLLRAKRAVDELHRLVHERAREINRQVAVAEIARCIEPLKEKYQDLARVLEHVSALAEDIQVYAQTFAEPEEDGANVADLFAGIARDEAMRRYAVNVLVSHEPGSGAPIIEELVPTLTRLVGTIERQVRFGIMVTDFTRITAGAFHVANGGCLILDAAEVLTRPLVWPALKRVLRTRELTPSEAATEIGLYTTETIEPEPVAVDVKVVMIGEPRVYYLLELLDAEFAELFKVKSDFPTHAARNERTERQYGAFIALRCQEDGLPPFDASAVARIVEHGSRLTGDQRRLTARLREIADLAQEAAHWAKNGSVAVVGAADVERALAERERRNNRPHRELLEAIERGSLAFEPRGVATGQLYGIGLLSLGKLTFGRPIRVMASAFMGTGGVIQIEREAALSGPIHSKGFLVLSGYLGKYFARQMPLILSASLSFDQLYEEVEGDSASATELLALMSAIGRVPLGQGIAVTGALNQDGLLLPVGGVTEKVEGFFAACDRVGLTGEQGVVLPARNVDHLTLSREVREAVAAGRFHVFPIERVDDAWPILTGMSAGRRLPDGGFPEGTVHEAVDRQLADWAEKLKALGSTGGSATLALPVV